MDAGDDAVPPELRRAMPPADTGRWKLAYRGKTMGHPVGALTGEFVCKGTALDKSYFRRGPKVATVNL